MPSKEEPSSEESSRASDEKRSSSPPPAERFQETSEQRSEVYGVAFQGPLPPPGILERFEQIETGAADRIITMAEEEQKHRHDLERREQEYIQAMDKGEQAIERRGQTFGFLLALIVLLGGIALIALDKSVQGLALLVADAVALVGLFIYNETQRQRAEEEVDERSSST